MSLSIRFLPLASGCVPLHLLRPIFLHFEKSERFQQLLGFVFQVLQQPFDDDSVNIVVAPWSAGGLVPELKADFRRSLTTHLFGWDNLLSLRMRLSVADLCWVSFFCWFAFTHSVTQRIRQKLSSSDPQAQAECGQIAQYLLTTIAHWVLRTIIRHLTAILSTITRQSILSG